MVSWRRCRSQPRGESARAFPFDLFFISSLLWVSLLIYLLGIILLRLPGIKWVGVFVPSSLLRGITDGEDIPGT